MRTDADIQKDVMMELKWVPVLDPSEIGVAVKDGVVTLSGMVDTYSKKVAAENAAKKIAGVKAVAEDIVVGVSPVFRKTDTEIAQAIIQALKWHAAVKEDKLKIKVEEGVVTLEGEVEWAYQRDAAKSAIEHLTGIRRINNYITVKPRLVPQDIKQKIRSAFQRSATIGADRITVELNGNTVVLKGTVESISEKEDAEYAAWSAPGVTSVQNNLVVAQQEFAF